MDFFAPNRIPSIILGAGTLLALVGLVLMRRGLWPRRVGRTLHCPKCDYILTGLFEKDEHDDPTYWTTMYEPPGDRPAGPPVRCPECGMRVSTRTAVRGERGKRKRRGWVGVMLLLVGLTLVGVVVSGKLRDFDWYRHKLTTWVIDDLKSKSTSNQERAWKELNRRIAAGTFTDHDRLDAAAIEKIIADDTTLLSEQLGSRLFERYSKLEAGTRQRVFAYWLARLEPQTRITWPTPTLTARIFNKLSEAGELSDEEHRKLTAVALAKHAGSKLSASAADRLQIEYLGSRAEKGQLNDADRAQFFERALRMTMRARPSAIAGESVRVKLTFDSWGPRDDWWSGFRIDRMEIDGRALPNRWPPMLDFDRGFFEGNRALTTPVALAAELTPGVHEVALVITVTAYVANETQEPKEETPPIYSKQMRLSAPFQSFPAGAKGTIKWIDDPAMASQIKACLKLTCQQVGGTSPSDTSTSFVCEASALPVGVAFKIFSRTDGGSERYVGELVQPAGASDWTRFLSGIQPGKTIDLIFRSDEDAAKSSVDVLEPWRGEIVFKDVPLVRER